MCRYSLSHLGDDVLLRDLAALVAHDCTTTAALLAHIAEFDTRRLYLPAAYPSTYLYVVHELRLSEDSALKRIRAARTARQFPAIFDAVADGRLNLSSVVVLTPYLTAENAGGLLAAAAHERALDLLIATVEQSKFAATTRPRKKRRPTASKRHIPAAVKRAVWERDQGRCSFVSESGQRCPSRTRVEFDHVDEVARG